MNKQKPEIVEKAVPKAVLVQLIQSQNEAKVIENKYAHAIHNADTQLTMVMQMLGFEKPKEWNIEIKESDQMIIATKLP